MSRGRLTPVGSRTSETRHISTNIKGEPVGRYVFLTPLLVVHRLGCFSLFADIISPAFRPLMPSALPAIAERSTCLLGRHKPLLHAGTYSGGYCSRARLVHRRRLNRRKASGYDADLVRFTTRQVGEVKRVKGGLLIDDEGVDCE